MRQSSHGPDAGAAWRYVAMASTLRAPLFWFAASGAASIAAGVAATQPPIASLLAFGLRFWVFGFAMMGALPISRGEVTGPRVSPDARGRAALASAAWMGIAAYAVSSAPAYFALRIGRVSMDAARAAFSTHLSPWAFGLWPRADRLVIALDTPWVLLGAAIAAFGFPIVLALFLLSDDASRRALVRRHRGALAQLGLLHAATSLAAFGLGAFLYVRISPMAGAAAGGAAQAFVFFATSRATAALAYAAIPEVEVEVSR